MNVITSIACVFSSILAYADPLPGTVTVKLPDGKPAVGARVWVYLEPREFPETTVEPAVLKTEANGSVVAMKEKDFDVMMRVFAEDESGRMGMAWLNSHWDQENTSRTAVVNLINIIPQTGQLTGPDGKPISGAKFKPRKYLNQKRDKQSPHHSVMIFTPAWAQKRLSTTSDAAGKFSLPIPDGYDVEFDLEVPGYTATSWLAESGKELKIQLQTPGTVVFKVPREAKGQIVSLDYAGQPKS